MVLDIPSSRSKMVFHSLMANSKMSIMSINYPDLISTWTLHFVDLAAFDMSPIKLNVS